MNGWVAVFAASWTCNGSSAQACTAGQRRRNERAAVVKALLPRPVMPWWA
jgi:hypothetical protein